MEALYIIGVIILVLVCAVLLEINNRLSEQAKLYIAALADQNAVQDAERKEWTRLNNQRNAILEATKIRNENLAASVVRLSRLVKIFRHREQTVKLSITWFVNPDIDIRVCKVRVREQLAIDLENMGALTYKVREIPRPDLDANEVQVEASINILNFKYAATAKGTAGQDRE